ASARVCQRLHTLSLRLSCARSLLFSCSFFFFNDTATTEIYTLSLHDALPIYTHTHTWPHTHTPTWCSLIRSEEHTSELQSHLNLVCRLLLDKKKTAHIR